MLPSARSGLYVIRDPCAGDELFTSAKMAVYCDMETDSYGWIVIQRRNASLGRVNFVRNWEDYENGFGDIDGEFWIGLKKIYELTNQQRMTLKLSVWNDTSTLATWEYPHFSILGSAQYYAFTSNVGRGSGVGNSPFSYSSTSDVSRGRFSTYDCDHDRISCTNCAYTDQGGWWYYDCNAANLNGRHQPTDLPGTRPLRQRLVWRNSGGQYRIYTHSEMKIRPYSC